MFRLFVYGSLKRGCCHHERLQAARYVGVAETPPGYSLFRVGDYPALVALGSGVVSGEIYEIDADLLADIDEFEDAPHLYQRVRLTLADESEAFAYTMPPSAVEDRQRIPSGIWTE